MNMEQVEQKKYWSFKEKKSFQKLLSLLSEAATLLKIMSWDSGGSAPRENLALRENSNLVC